MAIVSMEGMVVQPLYLGGLVLRLGDLQKVCFYSITGVQITLILLPSQALDCPNEEGKGTMKSCRKQ